MTDFSLFETMRYTPGEGIARLNLHLKRLETSARRLGFAGADKAEEALAAHLGVPPSGLPGISPARGEIASALTCALDAKANNEGGTPLHPISPLAGGEERFAERSNRSSESIAATNAGRTEGGAAPQNVQRLRLELSPTGKINITAAPFTLQPENTIWRITIAKTRTASTDPLIRHKTTRRALYEAARAEFPTETINEVILLNEKGELTEGTITNLFVEGDDGRLMTPPISSGCLAGVLRTSLICTRKAYNHHLRPEDLNGRNLLVGNSLRGLIRAELIGD
ncbi:branched-subunit amino acid aminotransferase/4-amino-4-deoxychorismate lyase [Rhizobium aquaticum]|uniref:Probable branched-chain-amino-acid aminotransferase n=1 Tax=Rhizobium aquaticum TaxID=1549636 RepID=A0ABV2J1I7_9HYPH